MARAVRVVKLGPVLMPAVIAGLMAAIAVASIGGVTAARFGAPGVLENALLNASAVGRGQLWRLVSFALLETSPWSLIFICFMLYWFAADLARLWGARRLLGAFAGLAAAAGALTCLVAQAWPGVAAMSFGGAGPVMAGLTIAWGFLFPARELRLFFVLRLTGRRLIGVVVGVTVLVALFYGIAPFLPELAAEAVALVWFGLLRPWRAAGRRRRTELAARGEAWSFSQWYEGERRRRGK
jgi:membrane associated rhomboid family serine protease